ncbi:glycosyl transferase family 2 [Aphanothece hegewaldii CCALA 016]|uniref:Glycosyl transferase family 2 n=1 Tax=Aphanothece hegewaldii CCALA 016 TaxID=2107694 RepID=A0A2T1M3N9_9CHRO|nr:glycosyltransferase family A protein [Aphanothece hegewaldii]PSF39426.1 glycosyl transferase family 2 [Aphanothece hegewaldii CCALA 016]
MTTASAQQLPNFSMVLETENLETADLEGIFRSLASLEQQKISPLQANEVWLIESGDLPPDLLKQLLNKFPWIQTYTAPSEITYYEAKMLGAKLATGEIIVYFDSDCIYQANWLKNILTPFVQNPDIQIVAGETTTRGEGFYGTAMTLIYIFPPFSSQTEITQTPQYFLNNVAFRRELLLNNPIPIDIELYRGNCVIHAQSLRSLGYSIWKQPQAKATHAPPESLSHFFWRFLLIGYDYYWQKQVLSQDKFQKTIDDTVFGSSGKLEAFSQRIKAILSKKSHILNLPLAIPIMLTALMLIFVGYLITLVNPNYLLHFYNQTQKNDS